MPRTILTFGASNSSTSINRQLAGWAASQISDAEVKLVDLNDFEMPIYSIDREKEGGIPKPALKFKALIRQADGFVISFAEHNGSYTVAFKNVYDWISRIEKSVWLDKPLFLMATSPGGRGGKTVLDAALARYGRLYPKGIPNFSLPSFKANFSPDKGITNPELRDAFFDQLNLFEALLTG